MLESFSSKAIMTKAKAMYSRHLTAEQYRDLMQKKNTSEIAAYLRDETGYYDVLSEIRPGSIHRAQLEGMLRKNRFLQYVKLMRYDATTSKSFYRYLTGEAEIEQILQMIRLLNSGHPEQFIVQYASFLERYASFRLDRLAAVRDFSQLLDALEATPYAKALRPCRPTVGAPIDYTVCETALRSWYFSNIEHVVDASFTGSTKARLHDLFQTRVELINIANLYRIKKYFPTTDPQQARVWMLPSWQRIIPRRELDALIETRTVEEFLSLLEKSRLSKYIGKDDTTFIEYRADCIRYRVAQRYLHFADDAPTALTAYMALSELELTNIITIIEGVHYGFPCEEIQKMLIQ